MRQGSMIMMSKLPHTALLIMFQSEERNIEGDGDDVGHREQR